MPEPFPSLSSCKPQRAWLPQAGVIIGGVALAAVVLILVFLVVTRV